MTSTPKLFSAGLVALLFGSLGGALVSVLDPDRVAWGAYSVCLVAGGVGVALIQLSRRRTASDRSLLDSRMRDVRESIEEICQEVAFLESAHDNRPNVSDEQLGTYDLPEAIDARLPHAITRFVDAREAISSRHGTLAYAEIMGEFAAGERSLNRVWSAAAEGYVDEVDAHLKRARKQFDKTRDAVLGLEEGSAPAVTRAAHPET